MEKLVKILIIVFIIAIIFIVGLILLFSNNKNNKESNFDVKPQEGIIRVTNNYEFFNTKNCAQKYFDYINSGNYSAVHVLLDKNYVETKNITANEFKSSNPKTNKTNFIAKKINKREITIDKKIYFVYGMITDEEYKEIQTKEITIIMDIANSLFAVIPENMETNEGFQYNYDIELDTKNSYNKYISKVISEEDILKEEFEYYIGLSNNNSQMAFNLINSEYKQQKFNNNLQSYIEYLKDKDIANIKLSKYKIDYSKDYIQYFCIDNKSNYYTFNQNAPMDFDVKLDIDRTIDISSFNTNNEIKITELILAKNCINQYLNALNKNSAEFLIKETDESEMSFSENDFKRKIYNILSENYIRSNEITEENILTKIKVAEGEQAFVPTEIEVLNKKSSDNVNIYELKGYIYENNYNRNKIEDAYFIINICKGNLTFSIEPISKEAYENENASESNNVLTIAKKGYNSYKEVSSDNQTIAGEIFDINRNLLIVSPEDVYEKLSKEYREKRFGSAENFISYAENIKENMKASRFSKYSVDKYNEYTQYMCMDQNNKIYIFNERSANDYDILLDTYTVEIKGLAEDYDNFTASEKVISNIDKIFEALNGYDYNYVYSKLDDTFKKNNFDTLAKFEAYIKQNLYSQNKVEYVSYNTEGDLHVYKIKITDKTGEKKDAIEKNIIMQLKENRDFVMSFNIK